MEFKDLQTRALIIREQYSQFESRTYGRAWTTEEIMLGYVGDIGDLAKLVLAAEGVREISDYQAKLAHELADCLWSLLVLADRCEVDLQLAFMKTMDQLENHLKKNED